MDGSTNASNVGGTVGDDTHPVKSVDGVLVPVNNDLMRQAYTHSTQTVAGMVIDTDAFDTFAVITIMDQIPTATGDFNVSLPFKVKHRTSVQLMDSSMNPVGGIFVYVGGNVATMRILRSGTYTTNYAPWVIIKQ